jgi:hypothetical protein
MKSIIIFFVISIIIGVAFLRPCKRKITRKTWEKYNHKDVII